MERYLVYVPRWYGAGYLIAAALFAVVFIHTMLKSGVLEKNPFFFVTGLVFLFFGLVVAVYVFVTGRYPFSVRPRM